MLVIIMLKGRSKELQQLDDAVYDYMKMGQRPNTRRNTRCYANSYQGFCDEMKIEELPADEWQLMRYAVYTAQRVSSAGTVDNYVGGVRTLQRLAGYQVSPPSSPNFKLAVNGIKAKLAKPVRQAQPMTTEILTKIAQ